MKRQNLSIECDNCGAKVRATSSYGTFTCEYCGHRFRIEPPRAEQPRPAPPQVHRAPSATPPATNAGGIAIAIAATVLMVAGGLTAWLAMADSTDRSGSTARTASGAQAVATAGGGSERIGWDEVGGPPVPVMIDGKEHVVGRIRDFDNDGQLSVRAYRSADLALGFRTPDLGTYSEAYKAIHYAVVGDRLLATDKHNVLRVYDVNSSKELDTHQLTDRADQLCVLPEADKVWVQVIDKRHIFFDAKTFATEEAKRRPRRCPGSVFIARHRGPRLKRGVGPQVDNFAPKRIFVEGDAGVLYGAKSPGTPIPTAVGFVPETQEVRWKKPAVQADTTSYRSSFEKFYSGLAAGRFITVYGVGSDAWHVGALDAKTGAPLWEVTLRDIFSVDQIGGFEVTPRFVYVVRTSSLDVLRAKDGKLIGAIGNETYED